MRKVREGNKEGMAWEFWAHEENGVTTGYFVVTASASRSIAINAMFFVQQDLISARERHYEVIENENRVRARFPNLPPGHLISGCQFPGTVTDNVRASS